MKVNNIPVITNFKILYFFFFCPVEKLTTTTTCNNNIINITTTTTTYNKDVCVCHAKEDFSVETKFLKKAKGELDILREPFIG